MKGFGQRLRDRARQLGLADATVAERLGLSQQRYFNYVSDQTEPDLEMLLRICRALDTTPNAVLGTEPPRPEAGEPELLRARIAAAVVDVLAREHRPEAAPTPARKERGRRPGGPPR